MEKKPIAVRGSLGKPKSKEADQTYNEVNENKTVSVTKETPDGDNEEKTGSQTRKTADKKQEEKLAKLGKSARNFGISSLLDDDEIKALGEEKGGEGEPNEGSLNDKNISTVEWVLYNNDVKKSPRTTVAISDITQATLRKLKEIANSNELYAILDNIVKDFVDRNRKEIKKIERELNKQHPKGYL